MPTPVPTLEAAVLALGPEDRARLLERLIESFEPDSESEDAWVALALRREAGEGAGLKGESQMVNGDEALARVRASLG